MKLEMHNTRFKDLDTVKSLFFSITKLKRLFSSINNESRGRDLGGWGHPQPSPEAAPSNIHIGSHIFAKLFLRDSRASVLHARVKITPREQGKTLRGESLQWLILQLKLQIFWFPSE